EKFDLGQRYLDVTRDGQTLVEDSVQHVNEAADPLAAPLDVPSHGFSIDPDYVAVLRDRRDILTWGRISPAEWALSPHQRKQLGSFFPVKGAGRLRRTGLATLRS